MTLATAERWCAVPNGVDLILADHEAVKDLFSQFDETHDERLVSRVIDALKAHDGAEQAALYPMAWNILNDPSLNQRCEVAHSRITAQIETVAILEGELQIAAFQALRDLVIEHLDDEERTMLAALSETANPQQLDVLGARILRAKQYAG
jgi:hypothetical protein